MTLTSFWFISAFIISLVIYYAIPRKLQWVSMLMFSLLFFIVSSRPVTVIYLALSVVSVTIVCRILNRTKSKAALISGVVINLGMLCVLKYADFFVGNFNWLSATFGSSFEIPVVKWVAPIGISFYTMQILAYLLDVYWEITVPQQGIMRTALFVSYWPQLTSGPIARHNEMKDQLYSEKAFSWKNVTFGLQRMMWGIFKSLVISNRLGIMVDTIYENTIKYNGLYIWFAAAMFLLQLYTDFSGCMDIVIGASECYGIVLPENFKTPFFSRSVQEYWQRWHITLGAFMRDYVLNPILRTKTWRNMTKGIKVKFGRKASVQIPSFLGMLCVWLLMGIWHGGDWKFIIGMGMWFWLCIVLGRVFEPLFKKLIVFFHINTDAFSWHLFQSLRVFILAAIGNMFFRIESLGATLNAMKQGVSLWNPWIFFDGSLYSLGISEKEFRLVMVGLLILLIVSALQEKMGSVRELIAGQNIVFRWVIYLFLIFAIIVYGTYGPGYDAQTFIYGGF